MATVCYNISCALINASLLHAVEDDGCVCIGMCTHMHMKEFSGFIFGGAKYTLQ